LYTWRRLRVRDAAERRKCWAIVLSAIAYITYIVHIGMLYNGKYHIYSAFMLWER
jgi:hypothetical protein